MKKLLLINPIPERLQERVQKGFRSFSPLNLAYIAALTPTDWEIEIIDESIKAYDGEEGDLAGITSLTYSAPRAYAISSMLRKKGIPTIMGGIHASMIYDEASGYVDTVVIGEADHVWPQVIRDFEAGCLKSLYEGARVPLDNLVLPRRDLFEKSNQVRRQIQTARGCPMSCDFCSVSSFNGGVYRQRPVEQVLDELQTMGAGFVMFVDDNILGYGAGAEQRAIRLFRGIIDRGLKIKWLTQTSINFSDNPEVMRLAAKSGCINLFIGFESINEESLRNMGKTANLKTGVERYQECIDKIHDHGISVSGGFIFGNDMDTKDVFGRTIEFVLKSKIDATQFVPLTPLPGTRLYERLKNEGRLLYSDYPNDWELHDNHSNIVFRPKNMTPEELFEGVISIYKETHGNLTNIRRFMSSLASVKKPWPALFSYMFNFAVKELFLEAADFDRGPISKGVDIISSRLKGLLTS